MATTKALSSYKTISRPKGEQSSYFSSLAKKQASAEDAIIDQQYADGVISAESYKVELSKRLARTYLTPLQVVTIQDKINNVDTNLADAQIDNAYAAGKIKTSQVLAYEKSKLANMPATDSVAYQKQAQRVQQLTDKVQTEARTEFRVKENLRIAKLPEDSSEKLYQKAQAYAELEQMARLDGDTQAADTFATQKINYQNSAKRAGINDLITNARLSISGQPTEGLSVPSSERGQALYNGQPLNENSPDGSTPTVEGSSVLGGSGVPTSGGVVSSGRSSGFVSPAIKNAFKSLDRSKNTIDRLYQERDQKGEMIATYQQAIGMAEGDQKTQLTIALNNLIDDVSRIDNTIANTSQGIEDTIVRIQEIQAKAAASQFSKELRYKVVESQKAEDKLERDFAEGKLTKEEYIANGQEIANKKAQLFNYASDGFANFGNDDQAQAYLDKSISMEDIAQNLQGVGENIGDYETVQVDPGGKVTNLFGQGLKPGDFSLTNVRRLKDSGVFDSNYVNVNGKYYRVYYPGQGTDNEGFPISSALSQDISKLNNEAFVYLNKDGKAVKEPIAFINSQDEIGNKIVKPIIRGDLNITPEGKFTENTEGAKTIKGLDDAMKKGLYEVDKKGNIIRKQITSTPLEKVTMGLGNLENQVKQKIVEAKRSFDDAGGFPKIGTTRKINGTTVWFPFDGEQKLGAVGEAGKVAVDVAKQLAGIAFDISPAGQAVKGIKELDKQSGGFFSNAANAAKNLVGQAAQSVKNFFIPKVEASDNPWFDNFGTAVRNVAQKYGIPEGIIRSVAAAETGAGREEDPKLVASHNYFNIGAFDKNPYAAPGYQNAQQGVEAFAKLISTDPRYAKAYAVRDNPTQFIKELEKAGYAGDPKTYAQRAKNGYSSYSDFIYDTPEFKRVATPTPSPTNTPTPTRAITPTPTVTPSSNQGGSILDVFRRPTITSPLPTVIGPTGTPTSKPSPSPTNAPVVVKANEPIYGPVYNGDSNFNGQVDWGESKVGQAVNKAAQSVKQAATDFFTKPTVTSPVPTSVYKPPTQAQNVLTNLGNTFNQNVQTAKQVATPILQTIGNTVSNAAKGVGNFLSNSANSLKKLFGF